MRMICQSCGVSVTSTHNRPRIEHGILLCILVIDMVAIGGLFFCLSQVQVSTTVETSSPTPTSKLPVQSPQSPTPTFSPAATPTSTQPAAGSERNGIQYILESYYNALNRHSVDDAMGHFTDEVEILINHGRDYSYKGPREGVRQYLVIAFTLAPDAEITEVEFAGLEVDENKARAQVNYLVSSKSHNLSRTVTEQVELVKQNSSWKIFKTDITY
ncbi:nuclear transport factor 2 family protein [Candidatus Bathyarchaeota archaeon]|nr:nuclear transport factor 2 family protein [Candidatus Bathyarchaeota archaeon]